MCIAFTIFSDKQQEIDVPSLKVEDHDATVGEKTPTKSTKKPPMSQIQGVRRLKHTNSFTGIVPKYGVPATDEEALGKVEKSTAV